MGNAESLAFPYSLGPEIETYSQYSTKWKMYEGQEKTTGAPVTIFKYPVSSGDALAEAARSAAIQLKLVRHPMILKYLAHEEIQGDLHLVTEPVKPLEIPFRIEHIDPEGDPDAESDHEEAKAIQNKSKTITTTAAVDKMLAPTAREATDLLISLGLFQVTTALAFLNEKAQICHGKVNPASIFISPSGDWKLGGFDYCFKADMNAPSNSSSVPKISSSQTVIGRVPDHIRAVASAETSVSRSNSHKQAFSSETTPEPWTYFSPEWSQQKWTEVANAPVWSHDIWSLGCLIYHLYGSSDGFKEKGFYNTSPSSQELMSASSLLPPTLQRDYALLFAKNPAQRISPSQFLQSVYFSNNAIRTVDFLDSIAIKTEEEKSAFFKDFDVKMLSLPRVVSRVRIIPSVLNALEHRLAAGSPLVLALPSLLKLASATLSSSRFQKLVVPTLIKMFRSDERSVRVYLLQNAHLYANHVPIPVVLSDILPSVLLGLRDAHPLVREVTVRALPHLCARLPSTQVEARTLDALAALQVDPQPEVRAHVSYSLAKLSNHYSQNARERVLLQVFGRALRDSFAPARLASIRALSHTLEYYDAELLAKRILPNLIGFTVDYIPEIRTAALKFVNACLPILAKHSQALTARGNQPLSQLTAAPKTYLTASAAASAASAASASSNSASSHTGSGGADTSGQGSEEPQSISSVAAAKASSAAGAVLGAVSGWAMSAMTTALNKAIIGGTASAPTSHSSGVRPQSQASVSRVQPISSPSAAGTTLASQQNSYSSITTQEGVTKKSALASAASGKTKSSDFNLMDDYKATTDGGGSSNDLDFDNFLPSPTPSDSAANALFSMNPPADAFSKPLPKQTAMSTSKSGIGAGASASSASSWDSWAPDDVDELDLPAQPEAKAPAASGTSWELPSFPSGPSIAAPPGQIDAFAFTGLSMNPDPPKTSSTSILSTNQSASTFGAASMNNRPITTTKTASKPASGASQVDSLFDSLLKPPSGDTVKKSNTSDWAL